MIKAFVFDWGNVLYLMDLEGFRTEISSTYNLDKKRFSEIELEERLKLDFGDITLDEFFDALDTRLEIQIEREKYKETFFSKYVRINEELVEVVKTLKEQGFLLFILSNNNPSMVEHMKKHTDFEQIFDNIIVSYQEKMKKPDQKFYEKVLEGRDLKFEECVSLDDREDLVDAAAKLEMISLLYTSVEAFKKELKELGVNLE